MSTTDTHAVQLRSLVKPNGEIELSLAEVPIPRPAPNEVLVRVEAAPINPSDLLLLVGPADLGTVKLSGTAERPVVTATIPEPLRKLVAARVGESMPVGNEGAGTVVDAGSDARALVGKTVAVAGGAMYAQYRCVPADQCLVLPDGVGAVEGAAAYVNPMTALGMLETMRAEGHKALVHTAAASSLGQMLVRACLNDGVPLVNVVRKEEQAAMLRALGAEHVVLSSAPTFLKDLTDAVAVTGATIGFDAIGGGPIAGQILGCMEAAINRSAKGYNRYGSPTHKQVYIYGALDLRPTELVRNFGLAWGLGGWLLPLFLQKAGPAVAQTLRARVASEITTTFATTYARHVSLAGMLEPDALKEYARRATGGKFLVRPNEAVSEKRVGGSPR